MGGHEGHQGPEEEAPYERPQKKARLDQELRDLLKLQSSAASGAMAKAVVRCALELCRLRSSPGSTEDLLAVHRYLLRSFQELQPGSVRLERRWLQRTTESLKHIFSSWTSSEEIKQTLETILCQDLPESETQLLELRWRVCVLQAAVVKVPMVLAMLRWPTDFREGPELFPSALTLTALTWWQAIFLVASQHLVFREEALKRFTSFCVQHGKVGRDAVRRPLLIRLAALAASHGLLDDARRLLTRLSRRSTSTQSALLGRLRRLVTAQPPAGPKGPKKAGVSLLERADHALSQLKAAVFGGSPMEDVTQDLEHLACHPLVSNASRAAFRCWMLLSQMVCDGTNLAEVPESLSSACKEASSFASARLLDLRPFGAKAALEVLPLPRCLFGVYRDLQVKVSASCRPSSMPGPELLRIEGEPAIENAGARRRHAEAVHEAWHSSRIVAVCDGEASISWEVLRRFPSHIREAESDPPLTFCSQRLLRASSVEVSLLSSLGIVLAIGKVEVSVTWTSRWCHPLVSPAT
ncbi:unnamed protein product [Durusdinium trenchii]|uniref:Uncharacterized protein n=1 Tax=Durusdinium trenchii TaxID=1381693 RepID=A0ABP0MSX7_9DINO